MKCKHCKNEIPEGSLFCMYCGTQVQKNSRQKKHETSVPEPKQVSKNVWRIYLRAEKQNITAPTKEECIRKARAFRDGYITEKKTHKATAAEMVDEFIAYNSNVLSPSTIRGYQTMRNTRFMHYMDADFSAVDWQKAIDEEAEKVSPKTIMNSWRLITASVKHANTQLPEREQITVPVVRMPKKERHEKEFLDYEQIITLLKAAEGQPCELGIILGLHSLRRSEIMALKAEDIDVKKGIIHVHASMLLTKDNKKQLVNYNKTESSTRDIPVMIPRLYELIEGKEGLLVDKNLNMLYLQVNRLCEKNGLPLIGVHGLRHSFASLAFHLKWSVLTTMQIGGWCSPDVPQKVYTHLSLLDENEDVKRMKQFFADSSRDNIIEFSASA